MAQKQFTTYQVDITSFELREAILGIVRPGRYSGYDTIVADGTPDGTIYLKLQHSSEGVKKLPKGSSTLSNPIGVVVTTQGSIIHEDQEIDIDIPDNSGGANYRWYVIYLEHDYVEVQGANNATYGVIVGTSGSGIPALTEDYHRVPIGYIRVEAGGTSISNLDYFPANSIGRLGDDRLNEMLWGSGTEKYYNKNNETLSEVGVIPIGGVIGSRKYSEENYIEDHESLSQSLDALDINVKDIDDDLQNTKVTKLDDWSTPDDNTDLDVSGSAHGLTPKLPSTDQTSKFLRGDGSWSVPVGGRFVMRTGAFATDVALDDNSTNPASIDLSSIVPADADIVMLSVVFEIKPTTPDGNRPHIYFRGTSSGGYHAIAGADAWTSDLAATTYYHYSVHQLMSPINSAKLLYFLIVNQEYVNNIYITVVGWQTYTP